MTSARLDETIALCHKCNCVMVKLSSSDVDECEEGSHVCSELCVNTPGSYLCSCPDGFTLDENDGTTCHGS